MSQLLFNRVHPYQTAMDKELGYTPTNLEV